MSLVNNVVVGIDNGDKETDHLVYQSLVINAASQTRYKTEEWVQRVQDLGAGEIVLNCMNKTEFARVMTIRNCQKYVIFVMFRLSLRVVLVRQVIFRCI